MHFAYRRAHRPLASSSHRLAAPISMSPLSANHPSLVNDEQVSFPHEQRVGVPIAPFYSQDPLHHTDEIFTEPETSRTPPVARLRPASWGGPPSWVDEAFENRRTPQLRSSVQFRGGPGDDEDLPFGGRTLPPLPVLNDPWRSGAHTTPSINSTSRDHSPGSEGLSATSSLPSTSFLTNDSDGE